MAGPRQSQLGDQWRPDSSPRESHKGDAVLHRHRALSPLSPRRERDRDYKSSHTRSENHHSSSHYRKSSRERSRERRLTRKRSRSPSLPRNDDLYRPSRHRDLSRDHELSSRRLRHLSPSPKRYRRSPSRSPDRGHSRRLHGRRSRSREHRISPSRSDLFSRDFRDSPRRRSPDTYVPVSSRRRTRSPIASSYRPSEKVHRERERSRSRHRRSSFRREESPRELIALKRSHRRHSKSPDNRYRPSREILHSSRRERRPSPSSRKAYRSISPRGENSNRTFRRKSLERESRSPPRRRRRLSHDRESPKPLKEETKMRPSYPPHSSRQQGSRPPHIDTSGYSNSPQYGWGQASPQAQSPYGSSRGGWNGQPPYGSHQGSPVHVYPPPPPPPYRQNSYPPVVSPPPPPGYFTPPAPPPVAYGSSPPHAHTPYASQSYRGGYENNYNASERRHSSGTSRSAIPPQATRGRGGHYSNLSWTPATGSRGGKVLPPKTSRSSSQPQASPQPTPTADDEEEEEGDNPFRPSKDFQVEDQSTKTESERASSKKETPVTLSTDASPQPPKDGKISFALKSKAPPTSTAPPPADLSQKLREPPAPVKYRDTTGTTSRPRSPRYDTKDDRRYDSRDERRYDSREDRRYDSREDRRYDTRNDRRYDQPEEHRYDSREERRYVSRSDRFYDRRDERWPESKTDSRNRYDDDRRDSRPEHRQESRLEPRSEPRVEPKLEPRLEQRRTEVKIVKRLKPKAVLSPELAASKSVYYRRPGNESVIGSGTYGKVFKAIHVYTKEMVALKRIKMEGERDGFPVTAIREVKLLQSLNHENVVKLQEVMVENNDCYMVFEYLSHDLTGLLNHPTFVLSDAHRKHLATQLFEGLDYLHRRGVLHRDIKAANILISNTGQLKLADFGLARFYAKRRQLDYTNRVITIWYRSPELLLGETQYGPAVDIWSAACVLVEIFTKHAIFPGDGGEINQLDRIYAVLGTPTKAEWPGIVDMQWFELLRPTERKTSTFAEKYRDKVTPQAFELLAAMLQYDPAQRPSAADVLEHPYFTSEEPAPRQALELKDLEGDWHEFESKALRKEKEKVEREARKERQREESSAAIAAAATAAAVARDKRKLEMEGGNDANREVKKPRTDEMADSSVEA